MAWKLSSILVDELEKVPSDVRDVSTAVTDINRRINKSILLHCTLTAPLSFTPFSIMVPLWNESAHNS